MKVEILGLRVDQVDFEQALAKGEAFLSGQRHTLVTPNPEFVVYAQKDRAFKEIINQADLAIPDGVGLIWASRVLGRPLPGRVAGADLAEELIGRAARAGKSVFFLGGRGGVSKRASQAMKKSYPGLKIAGSWSGDPSEAGDQEIRRKIGRGRTDLLLVAYGHPRQEYWINRNLAGLDVGVAMGVGGAFDFWSGDIPRAPKLIRRLGLEWVFRLTIQPWRIRRQLQLLKFVWLVLREKFS